MSTINAMTDNPDVILPDLINECLLYQPMASEMRGPLLECAAAL